MSTSRSPTKQPLKVIEIPLNKFNDEVIPHYQELLGHHKIHVHKLITDNRTAQLQQTIKTNKRIIRQLKELLYELDTLRAQVEDCDLDVFDARTLSYRKIILSLINEYGVLDKAASQAVNAQQEQAITETSQNPFEGAAQIQIHCNIEELKLKEREHTMQKVENLNGEIQDLHEMYVELNQMVGEQNESVEAAANNVETTSENVNAGLKQLMKAHKLKTAAYPVTGALLGSIIGGPIGMVAGLKVGSIAAIGCGIIGYTGGKLFNKLSPTAESSREINMTEQPSHDEIPQQENGIADKKDI